MTLEREKACSEGLNKLCGLDMAFLSLENLRSEAVIASIKVLEDNPLFKCWKGCGLYERGKERARCIDYGW